MTAYKNNQCNNFFRGKQLADASGIQRSTSLSSTSSAMSTNNIRHLNTIHRKDKYSSRGISNVTASENRNIDNEKTIDYLKNILGQETDGINIEEIDSSVINELLSSVGENDSPIGQVHANIEYSNSKSKKNSGPNRPKPTLSKQDSQIDENWKWQEPTDDDDNDSFKNEDGGLTLKVHSAILDESVNISNLNVSFNAAMQSRSNSASARRKAERHEKKVLLKSYKGEM